MKIVTAGLTIALFLSTSTAHAFGLETALVPDPDDKPLALRIWYPNTPDRADTAAAEHLPLIIISHGTGGGNEGHEDTARALADAGFVVAAIMHTGDNYKDLSYVRLGKNLIARPRHVTLTIDYMLTSWRAHKQLDAERIGMFGHSAGGFTALVLAGAQPDLQRTQTHCREKPNAWTCEYLRKNGVALESMQSPPASAWIHDARIKAAVIAAPAVGYSFEPNGLANVHIPIQLWDAEHDNVVDDSGDIVRRLLPDSLNYHLVAGAGHFSFLAPCGWDMKTIITVMAWFGTEKICSDPQGFDRQYFHTQFNAAVVQFLTKQLSDRNHH